MVEGRARGAVRNGGPAMMRIALSIVLVALASTGLADDRGRAERGAAIAGLTAPSPERRAEAIVWFARNGLPADDEHVLPRLADEDPFVRALADRAIWTMWSRSGDPKVDELMERGAAEVAAGRYDAAIATYGEVIRRKPAFAEGWNKRATVRFLAGDDARSLADCDEVMKRNPHHYGALSGYGQIYFRQQRYEKAIESWRRALELNPNLESLQDAIGEAERLRAQTRRNSA